jgi:nucleoside-diphosphate-sugar epimerase
VAAAAISSWVEPAGLGEHSTLEPTNPYSAAKAGAEMMCKAYIQSYKMPIIITRGNNVYGPHQFPEKLIPKFTLLASRGADLPIHGDGTSVRSYLYVEDVAEAFVAVLHKGVTGDVYNIGTQQERSVLSVAKDIAEYFKTPLNKVVHVKDRAFNDRWDMPPPPACLSVCASTCQPDSGRGQHVWRLLCSRFSPKEQIHGPPCVCAVVCCALLLRACLGA